MKPRHVFAVFLLALQAPILAALAVGWLVAAFIYLAAPFAIKGVSVVTAVMRRLGEFFLVLWDYYRIRRRWLQFVPPLVAFPVTLGLVLLFAGTDTGKDTFLDDYSEFFQTTAQVLAGLLIAISVEARAPKSLEDQVATRPAIGLTVFLLVLAELAALSALSPSLPDPLYRPVFSLTVGAGVAALLAVGLISRRILED